MVHICTNNIKCEDCPHCRYDEDYGANACFAKQDEATETKPLAGNCPLGGDTANDCADCAYAGDYHFQNGECVRRTK